MRKLLKGGRQRHCHQTTRGGNVKKHAGTMGILLLMLVGLSTAGLAATETIRPDAQGARTGWGNTGCGSGSSEYQCVDEATLNTGDYLQTTGTSKETFTFANTAL